MKQILNDAGNYVDWDKKKVVKKGLAAGTYYATYFNDGSFWFWQTRKEIKQQTYRQDYN